MLLKRIKIMVGRNLPPTLDILAKCQNLLKVSTIAKIIP